MNPIVEKFNETNSDYNLAPYTERAYYRPENTYYLSDKQENSCSEFDIGDYGWKVDEVFPKIEKILAECFGDGITLIAPLWGEKTITIQWEYNNYVLRLIKRPNHPRTSGYNLHITINEKI